MLTLARPTRNPGLTALAAAKFIESHGSEALRILDERAELAEELGHRIAAATWRDMAAAAARLLRAPRRDPPAAVPPSIARRLPRVWLP
jgi:hypothetical protein